MAEFLQLNLPSPERRSNPAPVQPSFNLQWLYDRIDTSDVVVNASTVKQIASVAASLRLITSSVRSLPLNVFEVATQRKANSHPAFRLISRAPNDEQTADQLLASVMESALLHGAGFIQISRNPKTKVVDGLWYLSAASVTPQRQPSGQLVYVVTEGGKRQTLRPFTDIISVTGSTSQFDGVTPVGPLVHSRDVFAKALAMQRFQIEFFRRHATPQIALISDQKIRAEDKTKMRGDWESIHGTGGSGVGVLDQGLDVKVLSSGLRDNDVTLLSAHAENLAASVFGCDVAMLGSATISATNASLVETNLQYLRYTLGPWLTAIENGLSRALCDDQHEIRFDTHKLLRMDPKSQADVAKQSNCLTVAEARRIGYGLEPLGTDEDNIVLAQVNQTNLPNLKNAIPSQQKGTNE